VELEGVEVLNVSSCDWNSVFPLNAMQRVLVVDVV